MKCSTAWGGLNNRSASEGGYNRSLFTEDLVLDVILILCDALLLVRENTDLAAAGEPRTPEPNSVTRWVFSSQAG